ncbi:SCO7613 C-terminal domain-containing membrane protein [Nonomuraea sp. NPDC050556]|uniref:SCO7613 C-terminal domain-containing membrane protein n=1 Tax=Nonomuraea sp. NPDC050556 TaxID=3364369 RepID=UPI003787BD18
MNVCPDCGAVLAAPVPACPRCALPLVGPLAAELWEVDLQLGRLRVRRDQLMFQLRAARVARPFVPPPPVVQRSPEVSKRAAQNMLLILGGLLLTVAAIVFTVVSWGHIGIGGRAAILLAVTGVALAVPKLLVKRGLTATAETVGALGLGLILLDGYAARRVGLLDQLNGDDYAALLIAVVALVAAGYSRVLPLKLPLPLAIGLAQIPLPLFALDARPEVLVGAFLATTVLDVVIWRREGLIGGIFLGITGVIGTVAGIAFALGSATWLTALALLGFAVVWGVVAVRAKGDLYVPPLFAGVVAATLALGAPLRVRLPDGWEYLPFVCSALVVAGLAYLLPVRMRTAGAVTGGTLALLASIAYWPWALEALGQPFAALYRVWAGISPQVSPGMRAAVVVFLLLAAGFRVAGLRVGTVVCCTVAALVAPVAFGAPVVGVAGVSLAVAVGLSVVGLRYREAAWAAGGAAVVAVAWGLTAEWTTYAVLGVLFVAWVVLSRRASAPGLAGGFLVGAALAGGGLVWAGLGGAGWPVLDSCACGVAAAAVLTLIGWYGSRRTGASSHRTGMVESSAFLRWVAVALAGMAVLPVVDVLVDVVLAWVPAVAPWEGAVAVTAGRPLVVVALAVAGTVVTVATRRWAAGLVAGAVVVTAITVTVALLYPVMVGLLVAGAIAATGIAMLRVGDAWVAAGVGVWLGVYAVVAALAVKAATFTVLPVLAVVALLAALYGARWVATVLAASLAAGEVLAVGVGVDVRTASLVSAAAGVVAVGAGVLRGRKELGYLGTAFLLGASWLRLWAEGVEVIEAYTVPFSLVLLGIGWWNARGNHVSSWRAYGTGLLFSFLPSLLAEPTPVRSLLLGTAALVVTVAGARGRLQAPAVLGALALTAVAVRELAPWIAEWVTALPRWVPIAVGGLLLLVVGATYEARKRDVIRLKNAVTRLR